jgi:protein CpxP
MTKSRLMGGALALVAALVLGVAVFAQHAGPHGPGGPMHGPHGPGGPEGHGDMLGHFAHELSLTDAQQAQVRTLLDAFHDKMKAAHEQAAKAEGDGPFEGLSDNFDEANARAAAQARATTRVELEVAHAKLMSQIYALLTAEQKAKVAELKQKFAQHRQELPPPPPPGGEGGEN